MPLFSEFFSTNDNCMCNVYGGWVGGYPIQCWRGVFDQLNNNLWSKHNHVWGAIGILTCARGLRWRWFWCFYEYHQVLVDDGGTKRFWTGQSQSMSGGKVCFDQNTMYKTPPFFSAKFDVKLIKFALDLESAMPIFTESSSIIA